MDEEGFSKVVAIDGPSGSGKSTVARRLADKLNLLYVDTGAMFRALALHFHRQNISFSGPDERVEALLENQLMELTFRYGETSDCLVRVNGRNLTQDIRGHFVSELASKISKSPAIRNYLQDFQRNLVKRKICVMEGRDIGTVIFPRSFCKIYLTASLEVRAERRFKELNAKGERDLSLKKIMHDVKQRDERDMGRLVAPLRPAEDALILDSTDMSLEEVTSTIGQYVKEKAAQVGWEI